MYHLYNYEIVIHSIVILIAKVVGVKIMYVPISNRWRSSPVECDAETECLNEGVCIESNMEGNCICKSGFTGFR